MRLFDFLLLDADGTLFDFDKSEAAALKQVIKSCGYPWNTEVMSLYHDINKKLWESFERKETTIDRLKTERFERLFAAIGLQGDGRRFNQSYMEALGDHVFEIEGALNTCKELSNNYRLYIITNGISTTQRRRFKKSPISQYMSGIFISEEIGCQKPDVKYFDYVASHIDGFDKNRALIIGDSLTSDMKGGNNSGIMTCWYNPGGLKRREDIHINYEIKDFAGLARILEYQEGQYCD